MIQQQTGRDPAAFVAALQGGDPIRAGSIARAMLADRRPLGRQWRSVAQFAATEMDWPLAVAAMARYAEDDPADLDRRIALADMLAQAGRIADAIPLLEAVVAHAPRRGDAHHFLGVARIEAGDREAGAAALRRAIALVPGAGQSWLALANAHRFAIDDALFDGLAAREADFRRAPPAERAAWLYALGKARDDRGEHDAAFAAFAEGARIVAAARPYDAAADRRAALATIAGVDRAWIAEQPQADAPATRTIFVTGNPRSGTTLVERILGAHSRVDDGGEVNLLATAAQATGGSDQAAIRRRAAAGPGGWRAFRTRHAALQDGRFPGAGRIVDKSLNTSRIALLVRLAMPDAPLVWMRRDPLDTAWSSFRTYFARGVEWSFDLAAMGAYHAVEDRLFAFWSDVYGDRLMALDYAGLVDRPDATIAALLAHCRLDDEAGVRDFHLTGRAVQTASVDQVRRPINRAGLDTAGPYRAHLAPYERAYAETRKALGIN